MLKRILCKAVFAFVMLPLFMVALLLAPLFADAQSYPSPTFNNVTVQGTLTNTGGVSLSSLATQAANTVVANVTASSASPTAVALPSCSTANSALKYTSATGFSCGTTYALTSGTLAQFAATTSAQLAGVISDGTGSGALVFGTNPALSGATISGGTINNTPIGATTPNSGNFTTLQATGTITPSATAGIVGTTTNNNANAGSVGEYVSASFSAVAMTNGVIANLSSISLTAGDWDVQGNVLFATSGASANMTAVICGISTTSGTLPAAGQYDQLSGIAVPTSSGASSICPVTRLSLSATTTVYAVGDALFSAGTVQATGFIRARRVR